MQFVYIRSRGGATVGTEAISGQFCGVMSTQFCFITILLGDDGVMLQDIILLIKFSNGFSFHSATRPMSLSRLCHTCLVILDRPF